MTLEEKIDNIIDWLHGLTKEDRRKALEEIRCTFCVNCGKEAFCSCENDE